LRTDEWRVDQVGEPAEGSGCPSTGRPVRGEPPARRSRLEVAPPVGDEDGEDLEFMQAILPFVRLL
jgi:hypothetical protein